MKPTTYQYTLSQSLMLRNFADDMNVERKNPRPEDFQHIETEEVRDWFRRSAEPELALLVECLDIADRSLISQFMLGFRDCLGDPTLDQLTSFRNCCRELQTQHAVAQIRTFIKPLLGSTHADKSLAEFYRRADDEYQARKDMGELG